jgi:ketosteroid isomerase-like protein
MGSTEANLTLVRDLYDRYGKGDIDFVFSVLSDEVVWRSSGLPHRFPTASQRQGKDSVRAYFELLSRDWSVEAHDPQEFIGRGERVAVRTRGRVRNKHTGKFADFDKVDFLTVHDGRVESFQEIFDSAVLELCLPG